MLARKSYFGNTGLESVAIAASAHAATVGQPLRAERLL
jgi:hypothetical protein